jgi:hypothetical protein
MSDFLKLLSGQDDLEAREITIKGETGTVYFRKLTAGEFEQLLKGTKVKHSSVSGGSVDLDLGENEHQRQMLVLFSACDENGKQLFKDLKAVRALQHNRLAILATHAEEVNRQEPDTGKD